MVGEPASIELAREVTDALVGAVSQLVRQLSTTASPPGRPELETIVSSEAASLLLARDPDEPDRVLGMLTLVVYAVPTGTHAVVEDVVVDGGARGRGIGSLLLGAALDRAREAGARHVDLTSRPSREEANRLYQAAGFSRRETNLYRHSLS